MRNTHQSDAAGKYEILQSPVCFLSLQSVLISNIGCRLNGFCYHLTWSKNLPVQRNVRYNLIFLCLWMNHLFSAHLHKQFHYLISTSSPGILGAVAPYAARTNQKSFWLITYLSVVSSRQRSYDRLRCEEELICRLLFYLELGWVAWS